MSNFKICQEKKLLFEFKMVCFSNKRVIANTINEWSLAKVTRYWLILTAYVFIECL